LGQTESIVEPLVADDERLYVELWVSLASLLRSYTAAHGLNGNRQATVELGERKILVRHGDAWINLERRGAQVSWQRPDGRVGKLEFTEAGQLCGDTGEEGLVGKEGLEEMDMIAERWARDLMQERQQ
jgi:hypothetical protein